MRDFAGKVAGVTGDASGIGLGMAGCVVNTASAAGLARGLASPPASPPSTP